MTRILITGASGYLGRQVGAALCQQHDVLGVDIAVAPGLPFPCRELDIRDAALGELVRKERIECIVHLAAVLEGSNDPQRDYDIDVNGTRNVLGACIGGAVRELVVTSSGAAYGYHADNPEWIDEDTPLRGNPEFAYADHKRRVESLLADARRAHPELRQLVLRPGTVLGERTRNQITALFDRKSILAIRGARSPFVFIWDQDVVAVVAKGVREHLAGIYNLAGDGAVSVDRIAEILGKPVLRLPAWALQAALGVGHALGLSRYSASQVNFLRYRPVLSNRRLKHDFGYVPRKTSEEVFRYFVDCRRAAATA